MGRLRMGISLHFDFRLRIPSSRSNIESLRFPANRNDAAETYSPSHAGPFLLLIPASYPYPLRRT